MKYRIFALAALMMGLSGNAVLAASAAPSEQNAKAVRVILVGDSTMATHSGYGDALCQRFRENVTCLNLALGGRSSKSYRAEGHWDKVEALLRDNQAYSTTYVLIQFGHNDQPGKPGRSTDLATEFPVNMAGYVQDVTALGAVPVLVTPLTRRSFHDQTLNNDLVEWAAATRTVAAAQHVTVLELNADSAAAVQAMGEAEADTLAMAPPPDKTALASAATNVSVERSGNAKTIFDHTHLGAKGASLFSHIVEQELIHAVPAIADSFKTEN